MSKMFIIKGIDATVTTYNKEYGDWSGEVFSKDNQYNDELTELTRESLTESLSNMLSVDIDFRDVYTQDDIVTISIIEDGEGYPDENGSFLVDYIFMVSKVIDINIDDVLKEGNE